MNCQNCHEPIEPGAAFCGNCGYRVQVPAPVNTVPGPTPFVGQIMPDQQPQPQINQPATAAPLVPAPVAVNNGAIPSYALATLNQHAGETQAVLAVIFGTMGIAGGTIIPILGLTFGVVGLCMGTISRRLSKRRLAIVGLILAFLAVVVGLGSLAWNSQHTKSSVNSQTGQSDKSSKVLSQLSTPCYSFNLIDKFNVSNSSGSCDATAYNGLSFDSSTSVYKVVGSLAGTNDAGAFTQLVKQAIEKDVADNLPGYSIVSEGPSSFAGSLAYSVYTANKNQGVALVETGVLHQTTQGDNVFDIVHAIGGSSTNLEALEAQWQWK